MKKFSFFLLFTCSLLASGTAQSIQKETLGINGSSEFIYANAKSYFIQQSIGQSSPIQTFNANKHTLRQGFLQPVEAMLINNGLDLELEVTVFPNPFSNQINIQFEESLTDWIVVSVYDVTSRQLFRQEFFPEEQIQIDLENFPIGTYILHGQMRAQTFVAKLIKH